MKSKVRRKVRARGIQKLFLPTNKDKIITAQMAAKISDDLDQPKPKILGLKTN